MNPYAKPKERNVGSKRPQIQHTAPDPEKPISRKDREVAKDAVAAHRRAIKKSARRHLKQELLAEFENTD